MNQDSKVELIVQLDFRFIRINYITMPFMAMGAEPSNAKRKPDKVKGLGI